MLPRGLLLVSAALVGAACAAGPSAGGGAPLPPRAEAAVPATAADLAFRAEVRAGEGVAAPLRPVFVIRNRGARRVELQWENCTAGLQAYRGEARAGRPAWDQRRWGAADPRTGGPRACDFTAPVLEIAPGDSVRTTPFQVVPTAAEVLGDSLPPGRWHFAATLRFGTGPGRDSARVDAGSLVLSR